MGEPATLVESVTTPVVTAIPTPKAGETEGKRGFDSGEAAEKVGGRWRSLFGPSGEGLQGQQVVVMTIMLCACGDLFCGCIEHEEAAGC